MKKLLKKVGISNPSFAIKQMISQVNYKLMWFREMIKNALEATETYIKQHPELKTPARIKIRALKIHDLYQGFTGFKFSVLNFGGMSDLELIRAIELFCQVDKVQDALENFGVGMKITLSRFSDVMIITYKNYTAHYVIFGLDDDSGLVIKKEVTEVTDWVIDNQEHRGYDLDHDWTEVILLGKGPNHLTQNTLTHTFDPDKKVTGAKTHALKGLFERFVDIPNNIEIVFEAGENGDATPHNGGVKSGNLIFKSKDVLWDNGLQQYPNCGAFVEEWQDPNLGAKVYLRYDAPKDKDQRPMSSYSEDRQATSSDFVSLIWGKPGERERYDIVQGDRWKTVASQMGIFNDYEHFAIDIELPFSDYRPTTDRSGLRPAVFDMNEGNEEVKYKDFVDLARDAIKASPTFMEKILEHNRKNPPRSLDEMMKELLDDYYEGQQLLISGNTHTRPKEPYSEHVLKCPECKKLGVDTVMPKGTKKCEVCGYERKRKVDPRLPEDKETATPLLPEFVPDTSLGQMFARFTDSGGGERDKIFVNVDHKAVQKLQNLVILDGYYMSLPPDILGKIKQHALDLLQVNAGITAVIAKIRLKNDEWFDLKTFDALTSPEAFTFQSYQSEHLVDRLKKFANTLRQEHKRKVDAGFIEESSSTVIIGESEIPSTIGASFVGNEYDEAYSE